MKAPNTLSLLALLLAASMIARAQTFHALLVADTGDPNAEFAKICQIDLEKMKKEVAEMANGIGYKLETKVVAGADFSSPRLMEAMNAMQVLPDKDIFFFYYSGAALCNAAEPDTMRTLQLGRDATDLLSTAWIVPTLEKKQARLTVVVVDGCGLVRSVRGEGGKRGAALNKVYQSLFSACGTVQLLSSKCSEFSYGNARTGSIFTNALVEALDKFINTGTQRLTWAELFEEAHKQTLQQAQRDIFRPQHGVMVRGRVREGCSP